MLPSFHLKYEPRNVRQHNENIKESSKMHQRANQEWLTGNYLYTLSGVERDMVSFHNLWRNNHTSPLPSMTHQLCHNGGLSLKLLRAALIATLARLQDKAAQLGLKSQLHLLKQSLWHYSGQIWGEELGNKGFLCSNTSDEPDEFQLMNLNTRNMHNEQRPKGRRDGEETSCHH